MNVKCPSLYLISMQKHKIIIMYDIENELSSKCHILFVVVEQNLTVTTMNNDYFDSNIFNICINFVYKLYSANKYTFINNFVDLLNMNVQLFHNLNE